MTNLPFLTEYDPELTSEGSIDPLGLYPIADRLATKLVPGFRERMLHPRFLTAMAVGAVICSGFDEDELAADGVSEPYMVYEWHVVQALVRTFLNDEPDQLAGLPGKNKGTDALKKRVPLNMNRYLKTAYVFGFHGVYRTLAREIGLIDSMGRLGEVGYELVAAWEKEQGLAGFIAGDKGEGKRFREFILWAVKDGLKKGAVDRKWNWHFNQTIAQHLAPYKGGRQELKLLFETINSQLSPLRREVIEYLISDAGIKKWKDSESEKTFHSALRSKASPELKQLLSTIRQYEKFARLITDVFESCLYKMSQVNKVSLNILSKSEAVENAFEEVPEIFRKVIHSLEKYDEAGKFTEIYLPLNNASNPRDWLMSLLLIHNQVQKQKPPHGKKPWFERVPDDSFIIYSNYKRKNEPELSDNYVHFYRTNSLWSFMSDLRRVKIG